MNFLAHLYLASETEETLLGAMLGDFVKGAAKNDYAPEIRRSIEWHRKIDSYTDSHELIKAAKSLFEPERRRVAGIVLDVVSDHYLAKNWGNFSEVKLADFVSGVYEILQRRQKILPEKLQRMLPYMIAENWLQSYREMDWIELTLERMSRRLTRGEQLLRGIDDLRKNYREFENTFLQFFPELVNYAENLKMTDSSDFDQIVA